MPKNATDTKVSQIKFVFRIFFIFNFPSHGNTTPCFPLRERERQTDRQTDRQRNREVEKHTRRGRETERVSLKEIQFFLGVFFISMKDKKQ